MSERFGACRSCLGRGSKDGHDECFTCFGTGFSGDARDYIDPTYALRISTRRDRKVDFIKGVPENVIQAFLSAIAGTTSEKTGG